MMKLTSSISRKVSDKTGHANLETRNFNKLTTRTIRKSMRLGTVINNTQNHEQFSGSDDKLHLQNVTGNKDIIKLSLSTDLRPFNFSAKVRSKRNVKCFSNGKEFKTKKEQLMKRGQKSVESSELDSREFLDCVNQISFNWKSMCHCCFKYFITCPSCEQGCKFIFKTSHITEAYCENLLICH